MKFLLLAFLTYLDLAHGQSSCQPSGPFPEPLAVVPSETQRYIAVSLPVHLASSVYYGKCGQLSYRSLLLLEALMYARDTITRRRRTVDYPLGLLAIDNCDDERKAEKDVANFESCSLSFASPNGPIHPDHAVFYLTVGGAPDSFGPLDYLLENVYKKPHAIMTVGDEVHSSTVVSVVELTKHLNLYYVAVVVSEEFRKNEAVFPMFVNASTQAGICNEYFDIANHPAPETYMNILAKINKNQEHKAIILLTNGRDTAKLFDAALAMNVSLNFRWIGFASSLTHLDDRRTIPPGCLMLTREVDLEPFYNYLEMKRRGELMLLRNPWMEEYLMSKCNSSRVVDCKFLLDHFEENQWLQYNDFISEVFIRYDAAAAAWSELQKSKGNAAFSLTRLMQMRTDAIAEQFRAGALRNVMILNYQQTRQDWHFVRVGTLINGLISELQGVWSYSDRPMDHSLCTVNCGTCPGQPFLFASDSPPNGLSVAPIMFPYQLVHRNDVWACILSGFTGLLLCFVVSYEIYALTKICGNLAHGTELSQSGIFLGQVLLLAIALLTISIYSFTLEPNIQVCALKRFMPPAASVLCFGALFVKILVLVSAKKGQYVGSCYQGLMLLFIVIIQAVINVQWLIYSPTDLQLTGANQQRWACDTPFDQFLKVLVFPVCLMFMCCVVSFVFRKNPYNYKENIYICMASAISCAIWAIWIPLGKFTDHAFMEDAATGFGFFTTATVILIVMFFPRSRQRCAMGDGLGLHTEDVISMKAALFDANTNLWLSNSMSISPTSSNDSPPEQIQKPVYTKHDDSLLIPTVRLKMAAAKNIVVPTPIVGLPSPGNDIVSSVITLDVPPNYATTAKSYNNGALKKNMSSASNYHNNLNKVVTFSHKPLMIEPIDEMDCEFQMEASTLNRNPRPVVNVQRAMEQANTSINSFETKTFSNHVIHENIRPDVLTQTVQDFVQEEIADGIRP